MALNVPPDHPPLPPESYPRTLDIAVSDLTDRQMRVSEGSKDGTLLYTVDLNKSEPHMVFHRAANPPQPVGNTPAATPSSTASFRRTSDDIDISIDGKGFVLAAEKALRNATGFDSSLLGRKLIWKRAAMWKVLSLKCVDETGVVYATYRTGNALKDRGELSLLEPCGAVGGGNDELLDEIVVTAVVNIYLRMRTAGANSTGRWWRFWDFSFVST
ncbi:hypothetical protein BJY01DRAFT_250455 [Aspergillus pseudoustus]|uniref:Uncharacterized protein n=1 Tax=Aspergillus pseudoustus TaxID=1810923 RepID=A0ABR4JI21_9EURO